MEIGSKQATQITIKNDNGEIIAIITDNCIKSNGLHIEIERPTVEYSTLEEIEAIATDFLVPRQIANYLKCMPYSINCQAQSNSSKLGFPVTVVGSRVKIPKKPFIKYCKGI